MTLPPSQRPVAADSHPAPRDPDWTRLDWDSVDEFLASPGVLNDLNEELAQILQEEPPARRAWMILAVLRVIAGIRSAEALLGLERSSP